MVNERKANGTGDGHEYHVVFENLMDMRRELSEHRAQVDRDIADIRLNGDRQIRDMNSFFEKQQLLLTSIMDDSNEIKKALEAFGAKLSETTAFLDPLKGPIRAVQRITVAVLISGVTAAAASVWHLLTTQVNWKNPFS